MKSRRAPEALARALPAHVRNAVARLVEQPSHTNGLSAKHRHGTLEACSRLPEVLHDPVGKFDGKARRPRTVEH